MIPMLGFVYWIVLHKHREQIAVNETGSYPDPDTDRGKTDHLEFWRPPRMGHQVFTLQKKNSLSNLFGRLPASYKLVSTVRVSLAFGQTKT